jgi:hypothetical protein
LKRLQAVLESIDTTGQVNGLLSPFYILYDWRVAYSHLGSEGGKAARLKKVTDRLGLRDGADIFAIYDSIVGGLARSYLALSSLLEGGRRSTV